MLARADIIVSIISDDYALGDVTGGASGIFGAPATGTPFKCESRLSHTSSKSLSRPSVTRKRFILPYLSYRIGNLAGFCASIAAPDWLSSSTVQLKMRKP